MHQTAKRMRDNAMKHVNVVSNKAKARAMRRKEEYLGARVPKELRAKVIALADKLEIPVSILIRNILEEAFTSKNIDVTAKPDSRDRERSIDSSNIQEIDEYPSVIGWEVMTLNKSMLCTGCGTELSAGAVVSLGVAGPGENHVILCSKCKQLA